MIMNDDCDLSEIEERLYSQIYHSTDRKSEQHQTQRNESLLMNSNKRYFNTDFNAGIPKISVRINFHSGQKTRYVTEEYNLKKKYDSPRNKVTQKIINEQHLRNLINVSNFDDINLKEIKAQVDAFPEFIKYLPQHIRKKLRKMNKRIAFIQKKKYLDTVKMLNRNVRPDRFYTPSIIPQSVNQLIKDRLEIESLPQNKIKSKKKDKTVISVCDEEMDDSKIKHIRFIEISSSDDETHAGKSTSKVPALNHISKSTNKDVFKRPDDDDVIFIEPINTDVINLEIDSESNCSISTKSSIDRSINRKQTNLEKRKLLHKEGKEVFTTPESNNSNDFLESTLADNVSSGFNFELHGTDFGHSKDSSRVIVKDVSGSESSCSVAACDLGGLLASSKCALFNEVDFESPSKNIFEGSNMESFGNYITPNRTCNKSARSITQSSPLLNKSSEYSLKKKKKQKEQLPNLSSIAPEETIDLEESVLFENEILPFDVKKKKKIKKLIEMDTKDDVEHVAEISCDARKKKKEKNAVQSITEDVVEVTTIENMSNVLPKLKIKRKKMRLYQQDKAHSVPETSSERYSCITESQTKKKHKKSFYSNDNDTDEMDSSVQIIEETTINTDFSTILLEDESRKKKKNRSKKNIELLLQDTDRKTTQEKIVDDVCELINNDSSEFSEATKKRKRKSKTLTIHTEEHTIDIGDVQTTDHDTIKRKRKCNKFATSDTSSNTDSTELISSLSGTVQSVIEDDHNEFMQKDKSKSENVDNHVIMVDTTASSSTSSLQFECDVLELETNEADVLKLSKSIGHSVSADQNSCMSISDDNISISSESDYDCLNIKGQDIQIVNVKYKAEMESFDTDCVDYLKNILINMSDDVSLWKIFATDRQPVKSPKYKLRCRKCREIGHYANQCKKKPVSICCLCAGRGHLEPRCPNKLCTSCGRRSKFFTTYCSRCAHMKHSLCKICKLKGHDQSRCPDLWRRYHLTITDGPIIRPTEEDGLLVTKWCSGCGKQGHLEYQCQYFARAHGPTIPYVIDYKDHLYRENTSSLSSAKILPSGTLSKSVIHSVNFNTASSTENSSSLLNIGVVEQLSLRLKNDNLQEDILPPSCANLSYIDIKPPTIKTILPIPQPIGSSSIKIETELVAASNKESPSRMIPEPMELSTTPLFSQSAQFFDQPSTLTTPSFATTLFSTQCRVTYLHAKYLCFHKVGISKIIDLSAHSTTKININPDGNINIQSSIETICASGKNEILNHLQGVCQIYIPTEKTLLTTYLEAILMDLSKEHTVTDLRTCIANLQENISLNKSIIFQQLNMIIYGHFKWEHGDRCMNKMKKLLDSIKQHDNIEDKFINDLKDCLRYLIEFERPIHLYSDIIESISEGKRNFFNVESLRIPEEQPSLMKTVIKVDPMKYEYVKNSFPAKFMIFRWTSKLDVTYCDESLVVEGNQDDVSSAIREFGTIVGEGPTLPDSKWAVFNIISHLFTSIDNLESVSDNINKKTNQLLLNAQDFIRRCVLRKIHFHLIVMRGLNGGLEKLVVLREFVSSYKPSLENDNWTDLERKQIQEAFDTVQFNTRRTISEYKSIYISPSANTTEKIILDVEEYRILKGAKEYAWYKKIDLSSLTVITAKYISISIVGTSEDRRILKLIILGYLDRAYIHDDNPKTLINKLENSLKKLWNKPLKRNIAQMIFNRIHNIESKSIDSYHIDILRKLYEQLNIYLFGCCRLDACTKAEVPWNNHVDTLRAYMAYLETVSVVPTDVQKSIYKTYNSIFCKQKIAGVTYSSLIKVVWTLYKKYENIDRGTIVICDPRVKSYLTRSSIDTSSLLSHSIIQNNPIIQHKDVQNFLNDAFMIIIKNNILVDYNSPIDIRKESFKLFCDSYSNIAANISLSLQSIDEIRSYLDIRKATDLLHHIQALEVNSQECRLITHKYQVVNIYLFGCCLLMDGLHHFNMLKSCYLEFSQPDKGDQYITDIDFMNKLIRSYEYIFWKGKKPKINYNNLLNQINITNEYAVTNISLHSKYIYDYFTYVSQGIDLVVECSEKVKVDIVEDQINENRVLIKLTGGSAIIENVTKILLTEIDHLDTYKDIPFQIDSFRKYLNSKIEELISIQSTITPLTFLRDVEAVTQLKHPSLPQCDCMNVCLIKEFLCCKLNKYIFGGYQSEEGQQHLCTMITLATDLYDKRNITLNIKQIDTLYRSLQYFFSQKLGISNYEHILHNYASVGKLKRTSRKLPLLPLVYEYLKSINDLSYLSLTKMQLVFDQTSPFVSVSGSNSYLSWIRDIFYQYNNILSKLPKNRHDLIIFLNQSFQTMQELDDPQSLWINICLIEQCGSNRSVELKELYVKLHRHLFGYCQLGNGKALKQILNQHLINLSMICNPYDIIPMGILQEIFFALEYIEGSSRQFSSQQYEDLINKSCKMKSKSHLITQITTNSSATAPNAATGSNEFIEPNINVFHKYDNAMKDIESNKNISSNSNSEVSQNLLVPSSNYKDRNIHVKQKRNVVRVRENISKEFSNYLKNVSAGKLLINKLKRLVHVQINIKSIILIGSENNVKIALTLVDGQRKTDQRACYQLRVQIHLAMQSMNKRKKINITSLYRKVLTCCRKKRVHMFTALHSYLFGNLKLCDGAYHIDVLTKFLHGDEIVNCAQLQVIKASFNYIFGVKKKSIDYDSIIRSATAKNKPKKMFR